MPEGIIHEADSQRLCALSALSMFVCTWCADLPHNTMSGLNEMVLDTCYLTAHMLVTFSLQVMYAATCTVRSPGHFSPVRLGHRISKCFPVAGETLTSPTLFLGPPQGTFRIPWVHIPYSVATILTYC
ncbi:hypothetical protein BJV78DRAFT_263716 [Lactifluus subvellereus]|nr:hypothetical protein BJV78DRAFT_263716 [Lactifluus subvellereus]